MKSTINWNTSEKHPMPFVSVLGLLSVEKDFQYPRVRECYFVPATFRFDKHLPKKTEDDFFEPRAGYFIPALNEFYEIVAWADMPNPINGEPEDE